MKSITRNKLLFQLGILLFAFCLFTSSCRRARIQEHTEWGEEFKKLGITNGCFMLKDHTHESVHFYNKDRCLQRFTPASTFKIFNSLVALELAVAKDDSFTIAWDGVTRSNPEWNRTMTMREAFEVSNVPFYQELARRIGKQNYQHFLDTVQYGNHTIGRAVDSFWLDNSLQISADEQIGFLKRLYFDELPFTVRSQSIVRSMMLREDSAGNKMYYKTGWGQDTHGANILWVVGFLEHNLHIKESKASMNKGNERNYPYFFALNFEVPAGSKSRDWALVRLTLLHRLLDMYGATRGE